MMTFGFAVVSAVSLFIAFIAHELGDEHGAMLQLATAVLSASVAAGLHLREVLRVESTEVTPPPMSVLDVYAFVKSISDYTLLDMAYGAVAANAYFMSVLDKVKAGELLEQQGHDAYKEFRRQRNVLRGLIFARYPLDNDLVISGYVQGEKVTIRLDNRSLWLELEGEAGIISA